MTRIARQLVEGLAQAYRQAHPEEAEHPQPAPSAAEVEQAGIAAFHAAFYGSPPPATTEEENP